MQQPKLTDLWINQDYKAPTMDQAEREKKTIFNYKVMRPAPVSHISKPTSLHEKSAIYGTTINAVLERP